jgi:hypothetical protein
MAKKKKSAKVKVPSMGMAVVPAGWSLGTDWQVVQIIPATGYWATYKDGGREPVVAWAMQCRVLREEERGDWGDDEVAPGFISRVIGIVACGRSPCLYEADSDFLVDSDDDFTGYEYDR